MIALKVKKIIRRRKAGFTLAEVTMAMGIAAVALSIVFAMMPASMNQLRDAADLSAEHRIFNRIAGEARAQPWSEMENLNGTFRYFTAQAMSLPEAEKDSFRRVYTAKIEVKNDATGVHASEQSRRIVINITNIPDYQNAFSAEGGRLTYRTYSALVTSMEK